MDDAVVFDLSPFVVEDRYDRGYFASNAISGTRLNTAIRDIPMNLEVVTSEFIRDTGDTNLREALRYSAGVVLESQSDAFAEPDFDSLSAGANDPRGVTRTAGDSATKLRGFIGDQTLREGFRRQFAADSIHIDRIEILRGPSALLYGIGNFGGVINFVPKKPQYDSEYYQFGVSVGNNGFKRAEFDATGPLINNETYRLAYRITASAQERGDFTEYYNDRFSTVSPSFSLNLFPGTHVLLENEFGYREEFGVGFQNIRNNYGDEAASPGRNATWLTDIFDSDTGAKIGQNVDNRTFRWSGPDTYLKGPYRNHLIDIEQQLGPDAIIKVGYAISNTTFDSRQVQGGPTRSPFDRDIPSQLARADALEAPIHSVPISRQNSVNEAPEGIDNAVIQYEWNDVKRDEERQQVRAELLYRKETENLGTHSFILGSQYMRMSSVETLWGPPRAYPGTFNSRLDRYSYKSPTDYTPFRFGVQGDGAADNAMVRIDSLNRRTWDLGYYGIYQGQFFNNRLTIVGGLRRDRNFGTLNADLLAEDVYGDVTDTTTYNATIPDYQQRGDDSPEHTASLWVRYQLGYMTEPLEGWTIGLGGYWQDRRQWFTGFVGGGGNVAWSDDEDAGQQLVQLWTPSRLTLNGMVEYRTQFRNRYNARFALNVDNLANDKKLYGLIYAPGITYRLSANIDY